MEDTRSKTELESANEGRERRPYAAPQLTVHGDLAVITNASPAIATGPGASDIP